MIATAGTDFPVRYEFSAEETPRLLSADILLWREVRDDLTVDTGMPEAVVERNPLLERLPVVEAGDVVTVGNRVWFLRSVSGRFVELDQLEQDILPMLRS